MRRQRNTARGFKLLTSKYGVCPEDLTWTERAAFGTYINDIGISEHTVHRFMFDYFDLNFFQTEFFLSTDSFKGYVRDHLREWREDRQLL
jgi:hypothetical protein